MTTAAERKAAEKELAAAVQAEEEATQPQPTPAEAAEAPAKSKYKDEPVENVVGDYPDRPYSEALSARHSAYLAERHPATLREIVKA
jgi:hypothetical protein